MFINRVHLMLFILKQHLLPMYRFTIKQAGLVVIKCKAFRNDTLFVPLQRFSSTSLSIFLYAYIFALKATNSTVIFPPSSPFMRPIFFYFFQWVVACYHPLNIHSYQTFSPHLLQYPCKNLRYLSHKQSCQYPHSTT